MGRRSLREERRVELARAFVRVLGTHGRGGATIAALAAEAGVAPGLVHHFFADKSELLGVVVDQLLADFHARADAMPGDPLDAYADAALGLGERSDVVAARAWVGLFADALAAPELFARVRRALDGEIERAERRSALAPHEAGAVVAFVVGALVLGAFAPRRTAGFAAPSLKRIVAGWRRTRRAP